MTDKVEKALDLGGDVAEQVRAAALAEVEGGTIEHVEAGTDGRAAYGAHMRSTDGEPVTVYFDEQLEVVGVDWR
jgi:hypothetical protein